MTRELYPWYEKQIERIKKRIASAGSISKENSDALLSFVTKLQADGTSKAQQLSYMSRLFPIARLIGKTRFQDVTRKQMEEVFATWRSGRKEPYKLASVNKTIECIKSFFRWVNGLSSEDPAPECVRWLRREADICEIKAEDLWTEGDITKVLNLTRSDLYRTLISVCYESGLRPGELRGLKMNDIRFHHDIVRIYCRGKTRKMTGERVVPVIRCYDILKKWVYNHPRKGDPGAWLWTFGDEPLPERNFRLQLQRLATRAHIKKPCYPYILRHTALTRIYKEVPTPIARRLAGHVGNSAMVDVYCHLAMSDLEDSVRIMNKIPPKDKTGDQQPNCPRCSRALDVGALECTSCGEKFSTRSACELDQHDQNLIRLAKVLLKRAEQNPKVVDMLLKDSRK